MKKNSFDIIVYIIILSIILFFNIIAIFVMKQNAIEIYNINFLYIRLFFIFQWLIIIFIVENFYIKPIWELTSLISDFTTWKSKWNDIKVKTNYANKNIRFIFKFLDVILNSLKI